MLIIEPYNDRLPVGQITLLAELCTDIAEIAVWARVLLRADSRYYLSSTNNCEDHKLKIFVTSAENSIMPT